MVSDTQFSQHTDIVSQELGNRQLLLKDSLAGVVPTTKAPVGSFILDTDTFLRYEKVGPLDTDWKLSVNNSLFVQWEEIDSDVTAVEGTYYAVDTSNNPVTITLPAAPTGNETIAVVPSAPSFATNNVTILANGNLINGQVDDVLITQNGATLELFYIGGTVGWLAIEKGRTAYIYDNDDSGIAFYILLTNNGSGETHTVAVTDAEAQSLVNGTSTFIVKPSTTNNGHLHNVTIVFQDGDFSVSNISGNHTESTAHTARFVSWKPQIVWKFIDSSLLTSVDAVEGGHYIVDTSTAPVTFAIDNGDIGDYFVIVPYNDSFTTNAVTVTSPDNLNGGTSDIVLNTNDSIQFYYINPTLGWLAVERSQNYNVTQVSPDKIAVFISINQDNQDHGHSAYLTAQNVTDLITGVSSTISVATSTASSHTHLLDVTYVAGRFNAVITDNHNPDPHTITVVSQDYKDSVTVVASPASPYQLSNQEKAIIDTTTGPVTVVLPIDPAEGYSVTLVPSGDTYSANNMTIDNNGQMIAGVLDSVVVDVDGLALRLYYVGGTVGWSVSDESGVTLVSDNPIVDTESAKIKTISGNYTLTLADNGYTIWVDAVANINITLPENITENLPNGFQVFVIQGNTGQANFLTQGSDVIYSRDSIVATSGAGTSAAVMKKQATIWWLGV